MIDLDALAKQAESLEPLPMTATRLAALVCGPETPELTQVLEIIQHDEALTARLLRLANSSWSASRIEIATVKDAVVRLGAGPVLSLALAVNLRGRMERALPEYGLAEGELWKHSVAASIAADLLGRAARNRPPAESATAALLHDIGKLVMARFLDPQLLRMIATACAGGATRLEAETEVLGVQHAELGGLIARSWGLPGSLVAGIRSHHAPRDDFRGIGHAVRLADQVAKAIGAGVDDNREPERDAEAMAALGLGADQVDRIAKLVFERFDEVQARYP